MPPADARVVSRFGTSIVTARLPRCKIPEVWESDNVVSMKAPRPVWCPASPDDDTERPEPGAGFEADTLEEGMLWEERPHDLQERPVQEDGSGVVFGICDWGLDLTHRNFRNPDGTTRLMALWDQRGEGDPLAPSPFDYGRLHTREAINAALREPDPCAALGYHPASGDPGGAGAHGTHVADIAVGNRAEPGSRVGVAPGADIVFVHLGSQRLGELANLGDSVTLLEGLDFVRRQAAGRPCVMHLSAGKTAGPHCGSTCLERAIDAMLADPGIVLVQSVGNYADAAMHTHARIGPNQQHELEWLIPARDRTPNELEIWYSGQDTFEVTLTAPGGQAFTVPLGEREAIQVDGQRWGNFYHRRHEPNSGLNHVDVFLYPAASGGRWKVRLRGQDVVDGRVHAWIERDARGSYQSRFPRHLATSLYTTNTICNSYRAIAVGAHDATQPDRPPTKFSSRGPTADGRQKPEISAPGYRIRAARSIPRDGWSGQAKLCAKSGTSMAAPWVSGTVALMMQAAGRLLSIHEIRRILIGTADPSGNGRSRSSTRIGYGYLNIKLAVEAARVVGAQPLARAPAAARPTTLRLLSEETEPESRPRRREEQARRLASMTPLPTAPLPYAASAPLDVLPTSFGIAQSRAAWDSWRLNTPPTQSVASSDGGDRDAGGDGAPGSAPTEPQRPSLAVSDFEAAEDFEEIGEDFEEVSGRVRATEEVSAS